MKKVKKISALMYAIFAVAIVVFTLIIYNQAPEFSLIEQSENYSNEFIHGEVMGIGAPSVEGETQLTVRANSGIEKGKTIIAPVSSINNFNTYKIGDEVQISKTTEIATGIINYETADYYHQYGLTWIFVIFAAITILIARKKGIKAILGVIISLTLFYFVFLKMIIAGYSPVLACLIFTLIVTVLTIPLIHGFNKKSLSAIMAIFIGYFFSIYISFLFRNLAGLGNSPGEEFRMLGTMYANIGLSDILIASLFMGAIGALIDTAISISSAIFEAAKEHAGQTFKKVYKIGMEVGKDILGSMINTLLFAYLASALPFLIFVSLSQGSTLTDLINMDFIALELTRTFIGAISLVALIPITASISAYLLTKTKNVKLEIYKNL
ncbi:YibE/F family protein [Patescibacteria group bacterium]|nr:YibE/F family protein [Patescibacteria group bacterium]